eukprot:780646-Pleurochrysis_carterae.AAC.1
MRKELRAESFDGLVPVGRWGTMDGLHASADVAAAMAVLGDLLHDALCAAGGGVAASDPSFGMVGLARHACSGDGTLSMDRGLG